MKLVPAKKVAPEADSPRESRPDIRPAPAPDTRATTARDLRRTRARRLALKVLIGVVLPTIVAAVYYGLVATRQYESMTQFTVQSADGHAVGGLELLIASVPGNSATRDSLLVERYVLSRDMLALLDAEHGFVEHYSSEDIDYFSRLGADASGEERYDYFRDKVKVEFDTGSGALSLRIRAFTPEKAQELATAITAASEHMVNEMMHKARRDRIALAQREMDSAEARLGRARAALVEIQHDRTELNPMESAAALLTVRSTLEAELAGARAELAILRASLQPGVPQLVDQQQRVAALAHQIELQNRRMAGGGGEGLNTAIAEFEPAVAEKEFAERAYLSAEKSLELARIEADRQHRYLVTIAQPSLPDVATHPKIFVSVLTVFVLALGFLGIGSLLLASVREHANL